MRLLKYAVLSRVFCAGIIIAQQSEITAVARLVQQFHTAFAAKDVEAVLALWSPKSPQRENIRQLMAASAEVRDKTIGEPEVTGDRARVRIDRESGSEKLQLLLECVKEQGQWKLWRETPAAQDLAARLVAAATENDRANLLASSPGLPPADVANAVIDLGREQRNRGNTKDAIHYEELAFSIAERAGAAQAAAMALNNIGLAQFDQGDYAQALETHQKSLARSEALHDDAGVARSLNNIGAIYSAIGELDAALTNYQKSLQIGEKLHAVKLISNAIGNIGVIYGERGDYIKALSFFQKSHDLHAGSADKRSLAIDFLDIGDVFLWQGDSTQAQQNFQHALELSQSEDVKPMAATALIGLGRVAEFGGDLDTAIAHYKKSLAMLTEVGDKATSAAVLVFLGSAYSSLGDQPTALVSYQKGLDLQKAIGAFSAIPLTMVQMAAAYNRKGDSQAALDLAREARTTAERSRIREAIWRSFLEEGKALRAMRKSAAAEAALAKAIGTIEELRLDVAGPESEQAGFFDSRLEAYHSMLDLLASSGRNAEAFEFAERMKARVLLDALKNGRTELPGMMTAEERQREKDLRLKVAFLNGRLVRERQSSATAQVTAMTAQLEQARLEYEAYETVLYAQYPPRRLLHGTDKPVTLSEAAQMMSDAGSAFVEFVAADDRLYLFAGATGNAARIQVSAIPISRKELAGRVRRLCQQLAVRDLGFRSRAAALYKLLLSPVENLLAGKRHLVIIPDGILWELPFQALVDSSGHYLLENCSVTYAPSLTALKNMTEVKQQRRQSPASAQLLAMGNPKRSGSLERIKAIYRDEYLGDLPRAETEVRRLARIYGEQQSHVYVGSQARESRFKAEAAEPKVLHLATHGILNNASPLYSFLLMAGEGAGSDEDGVLEARELMHMNLRAELVVLSACETARGRLSAGEGIIGLSWALLISGVPTTVLSQWKVDSESTSRLMIRFHENRKEMSDADALRAAALSIRRDPAFQHPFYWAPFIVIGAGLK